MNLSMTVQCKLLFNKKITLLQLLEPNSSNLKNAEMESSKTECFATTIMKN